METPKAKPLALILLALIIASFFIGRLTVEESPVDVDFSRVHHRDSIIAVKDSEILGLTKRINERDSIIVSLRDREGEKRDGVYVHLADKFVGAPDSTRESLINEALNAIK